MVLLFINALGSRPVPDCRVSNYLRICLQDVHQITTTSASVILRLFAWRWQILLLDFFRDDWGVGLYLRELIVMRLSRFAILVAILCLFPMAASALQEMRVPFSFQWGYSQKDVEKYIQGTKARVVERKIVGGRTVLVVEGIPQKLLLRAMFYFDNDALSEIELQYGDASWDNLKYGQFYDEIRQNIDSKFGIGRLLTRQKSRDGDILQNLLGHQWTQGHMTLRLFLYTANKDSETIRVMSLHYKDT